MPSPRSTSGGPATCSGPCTTGATPSTAGSPSRSTPASAMRPSAPSPRRKPCGGWSTAPTCSSRSRRPSRACRPSRQVLAEGISVNITLIFSLARYDAVMDAFLAGLEQAKANGHDLAVIGSVASFFVSRVDSEVDKRLGDSPLRGKAAIANARLAYEHYEQVFALTAGRPWPPPAPSRSGRSGRRPASRTRSTTTPSTSSSWSRPARSTPCPRRPSTPSPTMASCAATP